jgi:hypothetical protein
MMKKQSLHLIILLAVFCFAYAKTMVAQSEHEHHEHDNRARFEMDLYYGDIKFTDDKVTYYNSSGVLQTHNRTSGETYRIKQTNNATSTSHTIHFGTQVTYNSNKWEAGCETAGTLLTKETVVYLAGINILLENVEHSNIAPIMVNNSANAVYLILENGKTNTIMMECSMVNHHAGIEKELWSEYNDASGYLVITCESGYLNHDHTTHTGGHDCTEGGSCGILNVYGNKAYTEGSNNGDGGRAEAQGAAAIGSIAGAIRRSFIDSDDYDNGLVSGTYDGVTHVLYRKLKNLVIAGGKITAKAGAGYIGDQSGAAGIGLGAGPLARSNLTGPGIENLCITGGRIKAMGSSASTANIGGGMRSNNVEIKISGGYIDATERWREGKEPNFGKGAGIGSGAGGTQSGSAGDATITITGGEIHAASRWGAAIGGASGGDGNNPIYGYTHSSGATINISGGTIYATTAKAGAAIGSGGLFAYGESTGPTGNANITITGGTITASSAEGADIGTGGEYNYLKFINDFAENPPTFANANAGRATINITGENTINITANTGGIGGGKGDAGNGGAADITINAPNAIITASSIGGGDTRKGVGGTASVDIQAGSVTASFIGGGSSTSDGTSYYHIPDSVGDPASAAHGIMPITTNPGGRADVKVSGGTLNVTGKIGGGESKGSGAGGDASIYVTGGTLDCASIGGGNTKTGTPGSVTAAVSGSNPYGAGIYIAGSNKITVKSGYIGGGINTTTSGFGYATAYINATHAESTIQGQFLLENSISSRHCFFTMEGGTIDNTNLGSGKYVRKHDNGGAVYMNDPYGATVTISGGTIQNSRAINGGHGGAVFMDHGTFTLEGSGKIESCTAAGNGGAVYLGGGSVTIQEYSSQTPSMDGNSATNGGALYMAAGSCNITACNIGTTTGNTASTSGGGIYTLGTINFSNGSICNNTAGTNGGGIYITNTGTINISGTATISGNNVTSGNGGGVYQGGTMTADGSSLTISGNTKGSDKNLIANNVYLPHNKTILIGEDISATGVTLGIYTEHKADDPEVTDNKIPVLTSPNTVAGKNKLNAIYSALQGGTSRIADDRSKHVSAYTVNETTLYFTLFTFDYGPYTDEIPFANPINSKEQLYKYMCWVNGVNGFSTQHANATGNVTADISLSGINHWIPIGTNSAFVGEFVGNGHTISGLTIDGIAGYTNYGLFGQTGTGAEITDLYVKDMTLTKSAPDGGLGTLVGTMAGGTISGCIASGTLTTTATGCKTGGLVGNQTGGDIHSSCAMTQLTGYQMGGLVGELASGGTLKNSFANTKFTVSGGTPYVGGLVGVNGGVVENCYSRKRDDSSLGSANYGGIAGDNTETSGKGLFYSYASATPFVSAAGTSGNQTGLGTYGPTSLTNSKYGYRQSDQQITLADASEDTHLVNGNYSQSTGLTGLLATLNHWVGSSVTYAKWTRTMGSTINGDYPIHKYDDYVCVGSTDNISLEYSDSFTTLFDSYLSANDGAGVGTVYLYQNPGTSTITSSNNGKATELYIHEDVVLLHTSVLKAHVGITLDNSAGAGGANPSFGGTDVIDWHFFSSSLSDAPIGLTYGDNEPSGAYEYPSWQAYFSNANGYFPTNFNTSTPTSGDYYTDWDLYTYCEPDYHWINLKRNSASHWHEDGGHITYTNPTVFNPGQGFLMATAEECYLQAYGTLNTYADADGSRLEVPLSYTPGVSWTGRQGLNLLGNPFQSYLDFNAFATENTGLWQGGYTNASYIVMDEYQRGYVQYLYGSSDNPFGAGRYLHPHQGFMLIAGREDMQAKFHDGMRNVSATSTTFRGEGRPNYPLVNLFATDDSGNRDMVTVELGRPDKGGALKVHSLHTGKGSLYCHYEDEDYGIVFTQPGLDQASIRFATDEDCAYTMTWNTQNGEFSYLHLIDNITGMDIDCLAKEEYKFTSKTTDYTSRFRLVFGYTGIDEPEVPEPVEGPTSTFAFQMGNALVVNGEGSLQLVDLNGRVIDSQVLRGTQSTVSLPNMAAGVYVLRLTGKEGTKVQKMVIR